VVRIERLRYHASYDGVTGRYPAAGRRLFFFFFFFAQTRLVSVPTLIVFMLRCLLVVFNIEKNSKVHIDLLLCNFLMLETNIKGIGQRILSSL
jgi:hypothetical protein